MTERDDKGRFVKGHLVSILIKHKISKTLEGRHCSPKTEFSKNTIINGMTLSEFNNKANLSEEKLEKLSITKLGNDYGKYRMEISNIKQSERMKGNTYSVGNKQSEETINKRRKTMKERGFDCLENILKNIKLPTSYEQKIIYLCDKYNIPFKYVGDGKVKINYVNPDFIYEDKKLIIEVYFEYFKIRLFGSCENYETQRIKRFKTWGYKTLFIRGKELVNFDWEINCLNKIQKFISENNEQNTNVN